MSEKDSSDSYLGEGISRHDRGTDDSGETVEPKGSEWGPREERVRRILHECGAAERHYRDIQSKYRQLASTWMLAALAGIGYTTTRNELQIVPTAWMLVGISMAALLGIQTLALLDQRVYHHLLSSHFNVARLIEKRYFPGEAYPSGGTFPHPRTRIYDNHRQGAGTVLLVIAYYGVQSAVLIAVFTLSVAYIMRKEVALDDLLAVPATLAIALIPVAVCARLAWAALVQAKFAVALREATIRQRLEKEENDLRAVPDAEFETAWTVIAETGLSGRHINDLQSRYRQIASSWLLGTLTALVFLLTKYAGGAGQIMRPEWRVGLPVYGSTVFGIEFAALGIALIGCFGLGLLFLLDLLFYQEILVGWSDSGIALESIFPWLPPIRTQMVKATRGRMRRIGAYFYLAPTALLIALSIVFLYLDGRAFPEGATSSGDMLRRGMAGFAIAATAIMTALVASRPLYPERGLWVTVKGYKLLRYLNALRPWENVRRKRFLVYFTGVKAGERSTTVQGKGGE